MPAPLELSITTNRPRTVVGEGITLQLEARVAQPIELEVIVLNRARTTITITRAGEPPAVETLTGADHARLFSIPEVTQIGRRFNAPAGARWTDPLDLGNYRRPLEPGRYRIGVAYRWGKEPGDVARTNDLEVEVAPAVTLALAPRWFAGALPRGALGALRTVSDGEQRRLLYSSSPPADPGVLPVSVDVGELTTAEATPSLAHMNEIADMAFERWAAWATPAGLGWLKVQKRGRIGAPGVAPHGLDASPAPRLVEPALQVAGKRVVALLEGKAGGALERALVEVDLDGTTRRTALRSDDLERTLVVWTRNDPPDGFVFGLAPTAAGARVVRASLAHDVLVLGELEGTPLALVADQWLGKGAVALLRARPGPEPKETTLEVTAWDVEGGDPVATRARVVEGPFDFVAAEPLPGGRDVAILGRVEAGWLVLGPRGRAVVPLLDGGEPRPPRLVVGPVFRGDGHSHDEDEGVSKVWLVRWTPERLVVTRPAWER